MSEKYKNRNGGKLPGYMVGNLPGLSTLSANTPQKSGGANLETTTKIGVPEMEKQRPICPFPGCQKRGRRCMECRAGTRNPWDRPKGGRPKLEALHLAKVMGDMTYHGKECGTCEGTERYTRNSSCVACARRRSVEGTAARLTSGTRWHASTCASEAIDSEKENSPVSPSRVKTLFSQTNKVGVEIGDRRVTRASEDDLAELLGEKVDQDTCASGETDACHLEEEETQREAAEVVNPPGDGLDAELDSPPAPVYLRQDQIPQPWD